MGNSLFYWNFNNKSTLKNKDKKKMKMSLLSLNHGTIKLDYLIFYEQQSNIYLKVQVPISFIVS